MRRITRPTDYLLALCALFLWASVVSGQGQNTAAPNQNVEIIELGPQPGAFANIMMTPDFRHIAIVGPSGSRAAAFLDGRSGDKYEQIQTKPPVLSADGKRWAYVASKGGQSFIVVDGKEYGPYDRFPQFNQGFSSNNRPVVFQMTPRWPIVFSPDSKHFAFIAQKGNQVVVVEDGKEISTQAQVDTTSSLLFSRQGDHLVFVARDSAGAAWVVLDGVAGSKYKSVQLPQFSDDGHHLEYVACKTLGKFVVVVDGKEGSEFEGVGAGNTGAGILVSPDGAHVAYMAYKQGASNGGILAIIDGTAIPDVTRVFMSPDGKYIAYVRIPPDPNASQIRSIMVVNGKAGVDYTAFESLRFAPDGHPIYTMHSGPNSKVFLIDGNKESDAYDAADLNTLHFSADGKHTAYVARVNTRAFVVLDGKKMPEFVDVQRPPAYNMELAYEKMLQFTPDGHVIYHARASNNYGLVKDDQILGDDGMVSPDGRRVATVKQANNGTSQATAQLTLDGQTGPAFLDITKMAFSPDSKHFAYVGRRSVPNGSDGGYFLVVDGVQKGEYPEVAELEFSPDSQDLFHFTTSHLHGGPEGAYMDQKLFFTFYGLPGYFIVWLDDHRTMQVLGGKDDMMFYRVRYFLPGADRNQETASAAGMGAVDEQQTRRMLGSSGAASASAATAPMASGAPSATANAPAAAPASAAPVAQNAPPPGTTVEIKLIDAMDSSRDPAGQQYRATVTKPVNIGKIVIPQGAAATVTLARDALGWVAQLTSLVINGQSVAVRSSSASVTGAAQNAVGRAANAVGSVLGGFGRRANPPPGVAPVASGARVILPPGTGLSFVLGAIPPLNAAAPTA
jgi:Tol biopolymer transport system component